MLELTYKKSEGAWPVKALFEKIQIEFSGNFLANRIKLERLHNFAENLIRVALWVLLGLGSISLAFSIYQGWQLKVWLFLLLPTSFNLVFWISVFTSAYLWAKYKQEELQNKGLNLLHFEEAKSQQSKTIDIYDLFNKQAKKAWNNSLTLAQNRQKEISKVVGQKQTTQDLEVSALDLMASLLEISSIQLVFLRLGVDPGDVKTIIQNYSRISPAAPPNELERIPFIAFQESLKLHNKTIDPLMLLCALAISLPEKHILQAIFFNINLSIERLEILTSWIFNLNLLADEYKIFHKLSRLKPEGEINRGLTAVPTFYLDRFSRDLTWEAKHGRLPLALGRGNDLTQVFKLIGQGRKSLIIKGAPGTGRTTLVNELALKMVTEQVPKPLQDKRLVRLEISGILGTAERAESIFISALKEAVRAGNIVLVIEELQKLSRTVSPSGLNFTELLVDFLQNHPLTVIGTTTIEDYSDYLRSISNLDSTFASYELSHLTREGILLASCVRASLLENKNKCFFRFGAVEQAMELTDLYLKDANQPEKTISVLVEAALRAKNSESKIITVERIEKIISDKTHIPAHTFDKTEADKLLNLETILSKFIVGQKEALVSVAEGLRRARSGLASKNRPLASFLFLGPTGVGKTEVAKVLAREYFGESKFMLRLDMSEYQGAADLPKLLGKAQNKTDPPLIKHIKNYPFCLLLLDEFEKASSEILNLFLQILEDGRLTTDRGETIDMTHCLIIATSNAGTKDIQTGIKQNLGQEQIKQKLFNLTLTNIFPPELLNRFDGIILFSPLTSKQVEQIAFLQLQILQKQLQKKGIKLEFTQKVIKEIAEKAFDPLLGARPIRRYIQDHVEGFIAKLLLSKKLPRGSNVVIDFEAGKLTVKSK